MRRRHFIVAIAALFAPRAWSQRAPLVEVWRSPSCGCCGAWVKHLHDNGFATRVYTVDDTSTIRRALKIPPRLASCHTARVDGYAIEGHVPAGDIRRLLAQRRKVVGLAVPGMPPGSPGMDVPGSPPFDVLVVVPDGTSAAYSHHPSRRGQRAERVSGVPELRIRGV